MLFKIIDKYLNVLLRGWTSLSKRVSTRVMDQVFLILTVVFLENITLLLWAIILYWFVRASLPT